MPNGTVKFFNASKGFRFIAPDDSGNDVFVHASTLEQAGVRELKKGDLVSFEVEEDRRSGRVSAANLRVTGVGSGDPGRSSPRPRDDYGFQGGYRSQRDDQRSSGSSGRGAGQQMFERAIAECRARGCNFVQLTTDRKRTDAHRFYERLGFVDSHIGYKLAL